MGRILGHGIDLIECRRIEELAERHGERFLRRVFTEAELKYCLDRAHRWQHLAGRFAAKEAVLKALGTGWRGQIAWTDVEVTNDPLGRPTVRLDGHSRELAAQRGITEILVSITHTGRLAQASAIAVGE